MPVDKAPSSIPDSSKDPQAQPIRRKRLRGACDACRTKKTKCDSALKPGKVCTNCTISNTLCTQDIPRRQKEKKLKQMTAAYVETLETRIKKLEAYIQKLHPGEDIDQVIEADVIDQSNESRISPTISQAGAPRTTKFLCSTNLRFSKPRAEDCSTTDDDSAESDAEDLALAALMENMKKFTTATTAAIDERFYGQGSMFMFAKQLMDVRKEITGDLDAIHPGTSNKFRRRIYWDLEPWEITYISLPEPPYIYPEIDLLNSLVSLYFERTNILIPVLHRPTFMKSLLLGQHLWDPLFGMTVLLVCALGAKYSQDSRVMTFNDSSGSGISAGWLYFSQVQIYRRRMLYQSTTYDLQYYALAALYLSSTSMPQATWTLLAIGLRHAFEKGVHRHRGTRQAPSAEYELQKRAFWALVCLDSAESSFVGRACSVPLEAFDLEYPIECDDEYWDTGNPETSFRQPDGKPCSISAFVAFIKLCEILGFVLRTLYSNKKTRILSGFIGPKWEGKMVVELDSSLNKWKDSLPEHLHWDSERRDEVFFHQSVILHATYNYVQIQIHRPYLTKKSPLTLPSLAICSNAARTCSGILETAAIRGVRILPIAMIVAYTAGMVITLGLWENQSTGSIGDSREDVGNLEKCVRYLKECEKRWHSAGRLVDILTEAGAVHQRGPTANNHQPLSHPVPSSHPPASDMRQNVANMPGTDIANIPPLAAPLIGGQSTFVPVDDWDFQSLLLTEMGYLMEPSNNAHQSHCHAAHVEQTDCSSYSSEYTDSHPAMIDRAQDPSLQNNGLFASWYDIPAPVPQSFEEWNGYYRGHQP